MTTDYYDTSNNSIKEDYDINKLINKPWSELSDDEINFVVEWKANVKARDAAHQAKVDAINQAGQKMVQAMQEQAAADRQRQDELLQASIERMKRAGGEG